jgi:hypothetical protein
MIFMKQEEEAGAQGSELEDDSGKPTIDEPTAPALDPEDDEFDKQAEDAKTQ